MGCDVRIGDTLRVGSTSNVKGDKAVVKMSKETLRTVSSMHWFSIMAPQQPKNPTTRTIAPAAIHRAVALRNLKVGAISA